MTPRQRILAIKLADKIKKNPSYAQKLGVAIEYKQENK